MLTKLPNVLTFSRIAAIPVLIGLIFVDSYLCNWLALGVYTLACVTDFLDGYVARALEQQSRVGRFLDPMADKLLVASVLLVLVGVDRINGLAILPALVILCRELLVSGLREFLAEVRVSVPVSRLAKWKTVLQMVAIGFLVVGSSGPDLIGFAPRDIGVIGLWVAATLTLITGYDYLRAGLKHMTRADTAAK
ncbi:MAG TPA: CDP-diacylglycerol--glycerol-3-phosphate 3-phosphatidyltransferase [Rhodospirillales bacterium]|jgi:cardiolipin synthase|nr:CDP-diacylglycerol--glycerol-3-phosphate 3-phosphatidyltransferase [Rhodospirillales bacterium]